MSATRYGPHTPAWKTLEGFASRIEGQSIKQLFAADPGRGEAFCAELDGFVLDFSRQRLHDLVLDALVELAGETGVPEAIAAMFAGAHLNNTEDRAVLHVALRRRAGEALALDGTDVMPDVERERAKMRTLADALHAGELRGHTGEAITDVVNIGIGGSDLGLAMGAQALAEYVKPGLGLHFVSNVDGVQLAHTLNRVDPRRTLFVVCSKTFTTLETLENAQAARAWLAAHGGEGAVAAQFVAVSTNHVAMDAFGIAPDRRLAIWDWVGGRYSMWSAVGLTLALAVGWEHFAAFLDGGRDMDGHFEHAPLRENLPVLLALIGIWNRNFLGAPSHAVLPYDYHLNRFPAYLQQLEMESNGKSVRRNGAPVECATCPIVWGEPGNNAQHAFYQLLHQGTERVSMDFILPARSGVDRQGQQDLASANALAQALALAEGRPADDPHRAYAGNRPSSLILFERLDPRTLGRLVALYEHKVFVQGVIWDINSFDQWGVELGKALASTLAPAIDRDDVAVPVAVRDAVERVRALRP
jgi:glucose-6-phosphate isomerase